MKKSLLPPGAVLLLVLFVAGCETDGGVAVRAQEKPAAYAGLRTWQKKLIDEGSISQGFTTDMVYIAMGRPNKVEVKEYPQGHVELWTYNQYYPHVDAVHGFHHANFNTESAYQPQRPTTVISHNDFEGLGNQPGPPVGGLIPQTMFLTSGAQGGNMEPATLRSYTIKVLFVSGKAVQIGADENIN